MSEETQEAPPEEWAIVEVMGRRRHAGRIMEVERFGATMLRVDVPESDAPDAPFKETHFYGGTALYCVTPCSEATARAANKRYGDPVRYSLPAPRSDWREGSYQDEIDDDEVDLGLPHAYTADPPDFSEVED